MGFGDLDGHPARFMVGLALRLLNASCNAQLQQYIWYQETNGDMVQFTLSMILSDSTSHHISSNRAVQHHDRIP